MYCEKCENVSQIDRKTGCIVSIYLIFTYFLTFLNLFILSHRFYHFKTRLLYILAWCIYKYVRLCLLLCMIYKLVHVHMLIWYLCMNVYSYSYVCIYLCMYYVYSLYRSRWYFINRQNAYLTAQSINYIIPFIYLNYSIKAPIYGLILHFQKNLFKNCLTDKILCYSI